MLRFTRPRKPDDFDTDVSKARAAVEKAVTAGTGSVEFKPLWRDYKTAFVKAQHGKCGYCESHVLPVYVGDVEHYRPKGALEELPADRAKWGRERQDAGTVEGRDLDPVCGRGYWWLAYEWENYLLSCQICNEYWKKCLFPVLEHPRCAPPRDGVWETPLLLNPFGAEDPACHLHVDKFGQIEAWKESAHGRATIDTCGLDRENLRSCREQSAKLAYLLVENFQAALLDDEEKRVSEHGNSLRLLGNVKAAFAGMIRAIFEHETGWSWDEIIEGIDGDNSV